MTIPPVDPLRQLIEKWREEMRDYPVLSDERAVGAYAAVKLCAEELEAALPADPPTPPSSVPRYYISGKYGGNLDIKAEDRGSWVLWKDHDEAMAEQAATIQRLTEALKAARLESATDSATTE